MGDGDCEDCANDLVTTNPFHDIDHDGGRDWRLQWKIDVSLMGADKSLGSPFWVGLCMCGHG